jgi:hypothetical protein
MENREELLARLKELDITQVRASYSGSGDEGFIDQIEFTPYEPAMAMRRDLDDFFWEEVIGATWHEGFHNGDGGYGTITWDIAADKIVLQHNAYISDVKEYEPEEIK